jgi:hypothetical protein
MAKKAKKPQTLTDEFRDGIRERVVNREDLMVFQVYEDECGGFRVEAEVSIGLQDGRTLRKVFNLNFEVE